MIFFFIVFIILYQYNIINYLIFFGFILDVVDSIEGIILQGNNFKSVKDDYQITSTLDIILMHIFG